jgi:hypothetical protein
MRDPQFMPSAQTMVPDTFFFTPFSSFQPHVERDGLVFGFTHIE